MMNVKLMYELILMLSVSIKGSGHYWKLLKMYICIKPYLVTINGELLIVQNIVGNGSLWSNVVFEKEVIVHELDFDTSDLELEVSKAQNFVWQGCFFSLIIISQLRRPIIELKVSQVSYFMHRLRYTK